MLTSLTTYHGRSRPVKRSLISYAGAAHRMMQIALTHISKLTVPVSRLIQCFPVAEPCSSLYPYKSKFAPLIQDDALVVRMLRD